MLNAEEAFLVDLHGTHGYGIAKVRGYVSILNTQFCFALMRSCTAYFCSAKLECIGSDNNVHALLSIAFPSTAVYLVKGSTYPDEHVSPPRPTAV